MASETHPDKFFVTEDRNKDFDAEVGRSASECKPGIRSSTIGVKGVKDEIEKALDGEDPDLKALVLEHIKTIDADGDSRISHGEMANFAITCMKAGIKADKKNRMLLYSVALLFALIILLTLSTFGAATASVFLAKDTFIKNRGTLVTENNEPVSVNENILKIPLGVLAFVPIYVTEQVSTISFKGLEGEVYVKHIDSIVVTPEKSVVIETTKGDMVTWSLSLSADSSREGDTLEKSVMNETREGDVVTGILSPTLEDRKREDGKYIQIVLSNKKSWSIPTACEQCSAASLLADNIDIVKAVEQYYESVGLRKEGRRLDESNLCESMQVTEISDADQFMLELVNWARANPQGEADLYLEGNLNQGLPSNTISEDSKQPLAFNPMLCAAASHHNQWMLDNHIYSHTGEGGSSPTQRMQAEGYALTPPWSTAENIAYRGNTGSVDIKTFVEGNHENLIVSPGHRKNLMSNNFNEIGISNMEGQFNSYNAVMTTQKFAYSGGRGPFITGVVYADTVSDDGFYTIGEGISGAVVVATNANDFSQTFSTTTWSTGGYSLEVHPNAIYNIKFQGLFNNEGEEEFTITNEITIANENVKQDAVTTSINAPTTSPTAKPTTSPTATPTTSPTATPTTSPTAKSSTPPALVLLLTKLGSRECGKQFTNLGSFSSPEECALKAANTFGCGISFMYSETYDYAWGCRCCTPEGAAGGGDNKNWDLYSFE